MRLPVHLQREIARLHYYDRSQSSRTIGRSLGISANTVRFMREALLNSSMAWTDLQLLDDDAWTIALGTRNKSIAQRKEAPDWALVHAEMQRPDATLERLWREWRATCPTGIAYTQFTAGYRSWAKRQHVVMRQVHRPGEKLFVDFAGRTVPVMNPQGGGSINAQIFVAVLGYSNYTYLKAVATQTTADWVKCHQDCFADLGGVPEWIVPDNLKAAVWRREKDRTVLNPAYRECLRHYDTAALPTGVRKPKHKAKAEVGVQIAQRWILFALRDRQFFSLEELNGVLKQLTAQMNEHPFKKMPGSRKERFQDKELPALKPLPTTPFELFDWRYGVRVGDDHHIEHQRSFYSVPSELRGERVDLRYTATILEVMHKGRRVAMHQMAEGRGEIKTIPEHRPVAHVRVLDGEPRNLARWAQSVGRGTEAMIRHHLESRSDAVNGLRAARRMRELAHLHGDARFEEACVYALSINITALRSVESILRHSPDRRSVAMEREEPKPSHENIRGPHYFGERT
ncbi:IS21 family transposase [Azospirillum sp. B506]|uniref:IS21 family transposase n=1 Tax=Azospirillum sp. B506 TaxID=137721 RepID=UPI00034CC8B5|nr:IS21 family transposase [Azospirillum sp. B506]